MGIYLCHNCKHISEHIVHRSMPPTYCQNCQKPVIVYETVPLVKQIFERYSALKKELTVLKTELLELSNENQEIETVEQEETINQIIDFHSTTDLMKPEQHQPIKKWFEERNIQPIFDYSAVNMSGYYDEASVKIAELYDSLFKDILNRINFAYRQNHIGVNLDLKKYSQKEAGQINQTLREFYSNTLFSSFHYHKTEKKLNVKLQSANPIRQFFNGNWLEWFALSSALEYLTQNKKTFSISRNVSIELPNKDKHELDIVLLVDNRLIVIECKSGEFRREIDKYLSLKKRLGLKANQFIILSVDIDENQASSFNSMYELTFSTINNLNYQLKNTLNA